jgi:glycosyltransferase involved in cell wall biosynthesis
MSSLRICIAGEHPDDHEYPRLWVIREGLKQIGFEVDVVQILTSIDVIECLLNPKQAMHKTLKQLFQLSKHLSSLVHCDVILIPAFRWSLAPFVWFISKFIRKPILLDYLIGITDVNEDRKVLSSGPLLNLYRWLDWFNITCMVSMTDTKAHREFYRRLLKTKTDKMYVVPVGVREPLLDLPGPANLCSQIVVQYFGLYTPFHGVDVILKAAKLLQDTPEIRFEFIGIGQTQLDAVKLALAISLPNVNFISKYLDLPAYLTAISKSDILLGVFGEVEKTNYVVPIKVYEGMAAGRPVITAQSSAIAEFFTPGEHLVTVPPNNPEQLAAAIRALSASPQERERLGRAGRQRILEAFLPQHIGKQIQEITLNLVGANAK